MKKIVFVMLSFLFSSVPMQGVKGRIWTNLGKFNDENRRSFEVFKLLITRDQDSMMREPTRNLDYIKSLHTCEKIYGELKSSEEPGFEFQKLFFTYENGQKITLYKVIE